MSGPYHYNNWLKNNPVNTNGVYGFLVKKEMLEKECERYMKQKREIMEQEDLTYSSIVLPRLYTAALGGEFIHSRRKRYYVADLLPQHKTTDYYRGMSLESDVDRGMYLWNTLKECKVKK